MKDHVEIDLLTKYDAFRVNRGQVMDLEIWFKILTNVSNFETASPNWWCQFINWLKFETHPSSLLNFGTAYLSRKKIQCCKLRQHLSQSRIEFLLSTKKFSFAVRNYH